MSKSLVAAVDSLIASEGLAKLAAVSQSPEEIRALLQSMSPEERERFARINRVGSVIGQGITGAGVGGLGGYLIGTLAGMRAPGPGRSTAQSILDTVGRNRRAAILGGALALGAGGVYRGIRNPSTGVDELLNQNNPMDLG